MIEVTITEVNVILSLKKKRLVFFNICLIVTKSHKKNNTVRYIIN